MHNTDTKSYSGAADREALSLMTKLKLDRFKQRRMKFEQEYTQMISQQNDSSISPFEKVQMLIQSIERLFGEEGKKRYLNNADACMTIAQANISTSKNFLENLYRIYMNVIIGGKKCSDYNYLFGSIMSQWLSGKKDEVILTEGKPSTKSIITNEHLEQIIFKQPQLNLNQWRDFLQNKLFAFFDTDQKLKEAFDAFRSSTENYAKELLTTKVSADDVRRAIDGLVHGNSLDESRARLLSKMRLDENIVSEFASSLTLMISDLADWKWPVEGVRGIFRRNLVGKYRCYYEEDFLTAVFLEHIGLQWSYHFKRELKSLFDALTKTLRNNCSSKSIQYQRLTMQQDEYFMASLPDQSDGESGVANYTNNDKLDIKTKLFHLINVEIQLHQVLQPNVPFTVVTTDLEWFGPSISHEIIQIFLQHCGMPQIWLDFIDRFLKQAVYYKPGESIRQRLRGVPISHSISFLLAELLLFGLDLHVYQSTGIFNYRLHDDFWFFHSDSTKIEQVWLLMNEYTHMIGLKFNEEKCGSVQIQPLNVDGPVDKLSRNVVLPSNDLKWGLLILQPSGRFIINRQALIPFLDEMKGRLNTASSILEWVSIYNQYIAFFMRNFGKCAGILGTYHIEQMVETFQYLHRYVFSETNGNALAVLTNRIVQQFPNCLTDEICEAWFYWPWTQGGLGVENISLTLYSFHAWFLLKKTTTFSQLPAEDAQLYAEIVERFAQAKKHRQFVSLEEFLHDDRTLISFDEYIQNRETHFSHWQQVYKDMLTVTPMASPKMTDSLEDDVHIVANEVASRRQKKRNNIYIQWLVCYYGEQIKSTFNQLDFIDTDNLPIGLITLMKTTKIDWDKDSNEQQ